MMGLVAADGGPVTWPLLTSLQLAKEYALTGDRIPARRAAEIGLVNHVCADDEVLTEAVACAHRIAKLPRQAVEDTKRILNLILNGPSLPPWTSRSLRRTGPLPRQNCGRISTGFSPGTPRRTSPLGSGTSLRQGNLYGDMRFSLVGTEALTPARLAPS
jgi:hypothetical protein